MKTLYLHIGMPKTATSSIQKFLSHNREALEKSGYCYPKAPFRFPNVSRVRNAHFLIAKVQKADGTRDYQAEETYFSEGMKQIEECFQTYEHVVLSDESIWFYSSYVHKDFFQKMADYAAERNWLVKVIVYLRRQDEFLTSRWNQSVKQNTPLAAGMPLDEFLVVDREKEKKILKYGKKLDQIAAAIGKEHLSVRRFDRKDWVDGSIEHDFAHQIGLTLTDDFQEFCEPANLGLGKNETELKRIINRNENFTKKEITQMGLVLREMSKSSTQKKWGFLSPEETQEIIDTYHKDNAYVADAYFGDGRPLFSDDIKDLPKWTAQNEEMLETLVQFFATEVVTLRREQEQMRKKLAHKQTGAEQQKENARMQKELEKQAAELKKVKWEFHMFRDKVKHPLRTLFRKLFKGN